MITDLENAVSGDRWISDCPGAQTELGLQHLQLLHVHQVPQQIRYERRCVCVFCMCVRLCVQGYVQYVCPHLRIRANAFSNKMQVKAKCLYCIQMYSDLFVLIFENMMQQTENHQTLHLVSLSSPSSSSLFFSTSFNQFRWTGILFKQFQFLDINVYTAPTGTNVGITWNVHLLK